MIAFATLVVVIIDHKK
ncbi:hypothetical protein [Oceanobacillus sp. FSL W7-1309]